MKWIEIKKTNSILNITLSRPDVRNAFNPEMIKEIRWAFGNINNDIRLIVLRGSGKVFCSGADLDWMKSMVNFTLEENRNDSIALYEMFKTMQDTQFPIITLVQGAAMGGALGLLACSDLVLAESNSQFCFSEVRLGLAPAVISSFILQKVKLGKIGPWMISAKVFGVQEAHDFGLVHQFGSSEDLELALESWKKSFFDAAPGAIGETKSLLRNISRSDESEVKDFTTNLIAARRISVEGQEGLNAFLQKRSPSWRE